MTTKELVAKLMETLPDEATIEDVQYHLDVLRKIREGEEDVRAGRVIPHEDVMKELAQWVK